MTTPTTTAQATVLSEARNIRLARAAFHFLSAEMSELNPARVQVSVATDTYDSLDEMVDLIRDKLAPGTLTLWAVDSADEDTDGVTICITGNNDKGEDHAEWIATMWANMPLVLDHMDSLLTTARVQQESIDALTEQVRVMRGALSESEFAMNAVKNDVPWHVKDECMFDEALHIARSALAALEGVLVEALQWYDSPMPHDNGERARRALAALEGSGE